LPPPKLVTVKSVPGRIERHNNSSVGEGAAASRRVAGDLRRLDIDGMGERLMECTPA